MERQFLDMKIPLTTSPNSMPTYIYPNHILWPLQRPRVDAGRTYPLLMKVKLVLNLC
jgi:hypothetical protein